MRQDVAATISVDWAETGKPQPPNGVGDVASRPERSYRFLVPSSSPQAGAGLAPVASGALEPDVSQRLYLDTAELDLHGVALGLVRCDGADGPILHRPHDRRVDVGPDPEAGVDLPGVPEDVEDLDRGAGSDAGHRLPSAPARGPGKTLPRRRISGLRRRRQPPRIAAHRIERTAVLARGGAAAATQAATPVEAAYAGPHESRPRPPRPPEEEEQPADVADDDVACRDRIALGLADRALRQQRARASEADDRRPGCGSPGHRRCGIRWLRVLEGAVGQRAASAHPRRCERAAAEGPGLLRGGEERPGLSLAGSRGQAAPAPAGVAAGRGARGEASGVSGHIGAGRGRPL